MKVKITKAPFWGTILVVLVIIGIVFVNIRLTGLIRHTSEMVSHSEEILLHCEKILVNVADNVIGTRGYALTGQKKFLAIIQQTEKLFFRDVEILKKLTAKNPAQLARTDSIFELGVKRMEFAQQVVTTRDKKGKKAAADLIGVEVGKFYIDKMRPLIEKIKNEETILLLERQKEDEKSVRWLTSAFFSSLLFICLIVIFLFQKLRVEIKTKNKFEQTLIELNKSLEQRVSDRTVELQKARDNLNQTLENIHDSLVVEDKEGRLIFANREFSKMFGFAKEEFSNLSLQDYTSPESYAEIWERHKNRINGIQEKEEFEYKGKKKDGSEIWVEARVTVLYENGKIIGTQSLERDITERKRIEEELNDSRKLFSKVFRLSPVAMSLSKIDDGKIKEVNEEWCRLTGFSKEEAIGKTFVELKILEDHQREILKKEFLEKGKIGPIELEFTCADESKKATLASAEIISIKGEQYSIGCLLDITRRKSAEAEVRRVQEEMQTVMNRISDNVVSLDNQWRYTFLNEAALSFNGKKETEIIGKSIWELHPELVGTVFWEKYQEAKNTGRVTEAEGFHNLTGSWFNVKIYPSPDGLTVFSKDISERKKVETELRNSESQYKDLVENITDLICTHDLDGKILSMNPAAEKLIGHTFDPTNLINIKDILSPDTRSGYEDYIKEVVKNGSGRGLAKVKTFYGETRIWEFNNSLKESGLEKPVIRGYARDITQAREKEKKILEMNEQLRELSAHLQKIREEERQNIARELHDELGQQLTALKMDLTWIQDQPNELQNQIREKINGALAAINDSITSVRRINSELRPFILDDLGLIPAIEWLANDYSKRLGFKIKIEKTDGEFLVDPSKSIGVYRIFQEGLNNIAKYSMATEVSVKIGRENGNGHLIISDNGIGFDMEKVKAKKTFGFTGMRERTIMIKGTLNINSEEGSGTTLDLLFPVENQS